ncbi:MAG: NAD(P)-dependent oxidoreductase [Opitutaceae bacterium]|nr:NAD(P)-dependent oxidoreductase [Opitutaceae bacterium]
MSRPLTIWCNVALPDASRADWAARLSPHHVLFAETKSATVVDATGPDPQLLAADVVYGQPDPQQLATSKRLRWFEASSAGYARYDTTALQELFEKRGIFFSNSSSVFAEPCAQHVLSQMLMLARALPECWSNQLESRGWPYAEVRRHSRLLGGETVVMLGFGAIARRLVELLAPFRMKLFAVRRKAFSVPGVHVVGEDRLSALLGEADHVINLLPEGESTFHFVNARRLACIKPGARFYNIGRGGTVDQRALREALESGRLGAACLDVMTPEPLPPDDPLWSAPRCYLTPHTGGGFSGELEALLAHFAQNLASVAAGDPPTLDRIW